MSDEQTLLGDDPRELVYLGDEAEKFGRTPIGKYLLGCAEREYDKALLALAEVDPTDAEKIRQLQSDLRRAASIPAWISELIEAGNIAYDQLVEQEEAT